MKIFSKRKKPYIADTYSVAGGENKSVFAISQMENFHDGKIYACMRHAVPVIDAAISKIVRLTGGFSVVTDDLPYQNMLVDIWKCGRGNNHRQRGIWSCRAYECILRKYLDRKGIGQFTT